MCVHPPSPTNPHFLCWVQPDGKAPALQSSSFTHRVWWVSCCWGSGRPCVCKMRHVTKENFCLASTGVVGAAARLPVGRCMFQLQCSGKQAVCMCVCVCSYRWHPCFLLLSFHLPLWGFSWLCYINIRHFYSISFQYIDVFFFFTLINIIHCEVSFRWWIQTFRTTKSCFFFLIQKKTKIICCTFSTESFCFFSPDTLSS